MSEPTDTEPAAEPATEPAVEPELEPDAEPVAEPSTPPHGSTVAEFRAGNPWLAGLVGIGCLLLAGVGSAWILGDVLSSAERLNRRVSVPVGITKSATAATVELPGCAGLVRSVVITAMSDEAVSGTVDETLFAAFVDGAQPGVDSGIGQGDGLGLFSGGASVQSVPIDIDDIDKLLISVPGDPAQIVGHIEVSVITNRGAGITTIDVPSDARPGVYVNGATEPLSLDEFGALPCPTSNE